MKYKIITLLGAAALSLSAAPNAFSGELIYRPTNPAFGGNSFNGSHFLALATTQRQFDAPVDDIDPLANFQRTITSSLLSRAASEISEAIFGEDQADSGNFSVGDANIGFQRDGGTVNVNIRDNITGGETSISLPISGF